VAITIRQESYETFNVLAVSGRVDPADVNTLEARIRDSFGGNQASLVFDFSGLEFIISSGMGLLLVARNLADEKGGKVVAAGVREDVYRVFDLLDFPSFFTFYETKDKAIEDLLR